MNPPNRATGANKIRPRISSYRFEISNQPARQPSGRGAPQGKASSVFTSRAASDVNERQQLVGRAPLETFGNVIRDGQRCAVELVAKATSGAKRFVFQEVLREFVEFNGFLPYGHVFEV